MDYEKGYVFDLMEQGGPTDVREPYFSILVICQEKNKRKNDMFS